jgi:hypothetical protein
MTLSAISDRRTAVNRKTASAAVSPKFDQVL